MQPPYFLRGEGNKAAALEANILVSNYILHNLLCINYTLSRPINFKRCVLYWTASCIIIDLPVQRLGEAIFWRGGGGGPCNVSN